MGCSREPSAPTWGVIDSRVSKADRALVRFALGRGFLSTSQLRLALLVQDELIEQGQSAALLPLLRKHLPPERLQELREVYERHRSDSGPLHDTEVAVPEHILQSTCARVSLPPEQDPSAVRDTLDQLLSDADREGLTLRLDLQLSE